MTAGRPAHKAPAGDPPDIVEWWTSACMERRIRDHGADCLTCPRRDECQKEADRRIGRIVDAKFGTRRKKGHGLC